MLHSVGNVKNEPSSCVKNERELEKSNAGLSVLESYKNDQTQLSESSGGRGFRSASTSTSDEEYWYLEKIFTSHLCRSIFMEINTYCSSQHINYYLTVYPFNMLQFTKIKYRIGRSPMKLMKHLLII